MEQFRKNVMQKQQLQYWNQYKVTTSIQQRKQS
jgi:hypothetical protein